jgi:Ca-activated chloride channel family protein
MGKNRSLVMLAGLGILLQLGTARLLGQRIPPYFLQVDVDWITVSFGAFGWHGRPVENLHKEDLILLEDGQVQVISAFERVPVPLTMVVLLDSSESMKNHAREERAACHLLSSKLEKVDHVAVLGFSDNPQLILDFTSDLPAIHRVLEEFPLEFRGASNINDSIFFASRLLSARPPEERKIIFLISDGQGNRGDNFRAETVLQSVRASLMGFSIGMTSQLFGGVESLHRMIRNSGGRMVGLTPDKNLNAANLSREFWIARGQYQLSFASSNPKRDGKFRQLELMLDARSPRFSLGIYIEAPHGYLAAQSGAPSLDSPAILISTKPE